LGDLPSRGHREKERRALLVVDAEAPALALTEAEERELAYYQALRQRGLPVRMPLRCAGCPLAGLVWWGGR